MTRFRLLRSSIFVFTGWFSSYKFGSKEAVPKRSEAAAKAGADDMATDQYEERETFLKHANSLRFLQPQPTDSYNGLPLRFCRNQQSAQMNAYI